MTAEIVDIDQNTTSRKLATIRKISQLLPIPGADKIETAVIDGWTVVVKKGEFNIGDLCVYFEVDSWVPHTLAPFLTKPEHYPKVFNGVEGQRLKTIRLKGQLSQGLVLPLIEEYHVKFAETFEYSYEARYLIEGDDVTEILGIQKWEKPLAACLAGTARGNFPSEVPKTDQERIQNLTRNLEQWVDESLDWEVTEKLHGSSCTFYLDKEGVFHVCSRNLDLKEDEGNAFWKAARKYNVEQGMRNLEMFGVAIQGELIGPGINGNQYGVPEGDVQFYVFDMYSAVEKNYCPATHRPFIALGLNLEHVPVIRIGRLPGHSVQEILQYAEGESKLNNSKREGVVFKCVQKPDVSFKAINNSWLLDGNDDK